MNIIGFKKLCGHLILIILSICYLVILFPSQVCEASQKQINIAGLWRSNINLEYKIFQDNTNFTWDAIGRNQKANGKINGLKVSAFWQGKKGMVSASGTIRLDPMGRAIAIKWSNGVVFKRDLPPERGVPENQTSKPSEVRLGGKTVEDRTIKKAITPKQIGRPFVYDFELSLKTAYTGVLSVSYSYNPSSANQPQIDCEIWASMRHVGGGSSKLTPIKKSPDGKVLIPIGVSKQDVLWGGLEGPGNTTKEIDFILKEKGKTKQLRITYPFKHVWGDNRVTLLGTKILPHSSNKKKVRLSFSCSIDQYLFDKGPWFFNQGDATIELLVTPIFKDREIYNAGSSSKILTVSGKVVETQHKIVDAEYITSNPQCDAVRVQLRFYHVNTLHRIFYDTILKVNL